MISINSKPHRNCKKNVTPKNKQFYIVIINLVSKLAYVSRIAPRKLAELIEFSVTKHIPRNLIFARSLLDLTSSSLLHSLDVINPFYWLKSHTTNRLKCEKYVSYLDP